MSRHVTITDKDRDVPMTEDGQWRVWSIRDRDGKIKPSVRPDEPGTYILQVQVKGTDTIEPDSAIEVRIQRYPMDPDDHGTAWNSIDTKRAVQGGVWFGTFYGKVEIFDTGTYSRSIGIEYRVRGGRVNANQRVLKFIKQD